MRLRKRGKGKSKGVPQSDEVTRMVLNDITRNFLTEAGMPGMHKDAVVTTHHEEILIQSFIMTAMHAIMRHDPHDPNAPSPIKGINLSPSMCDGCGQPSSVLEIDSPFGQFVAVLFKQDGTHYGMLSDQ